MVDVFTKVYEDYKNLSKEKKDFYLKFRYIKIKELKFLSIPFSFIGTTIIMSSIFFGDLLMGLFGFFVGCVPLILFIKLMCLSEKFLKENGKKVK